MCSEILYVSITIHVHSRPGSPKKKHLTLPRLRTLDSNAQQGTRHQNISKTFLYKIR